MADASRPTDGGPEIDDEITVKPKDHYNERLVEHVHPPHWRNPDPADRYHMVVIGGGTAGLVSAAGAAGLGARVALVERHLLGGDCLNVGCVPSKAVIRAARAWRDAAAGAQFGAGATRDSGDFAKVMERMRRLRASIAPHDGAVRFRDLGVDVFLGHGRFTDSHTISVDGTALRFRRAVIATGARAVPLPIPGIVDAGYLTNETVFELVERPESLIVIGAGPIGCELAQAFARFGTRVTLLEQANHMLPREDSDAAAIVEQSMVLDGVGFEPGVDIRSVENTPAGKRVIFERVGVRHSVKADEVLLSVGRAPNVEDLGLDVAGVDLDAAGVKVDDRMRTTNRRVFACGDVASRYKFTHAADAQARIVIQNALFFGRARASRIVVPWCTYTSPEIAHVGMYESDAARAGIALDTVTVELSDVDRAVLDGQTDGLLRVHLKKGTDRIVGATLVAEHAGETIGELCLAITAGVGLSKIAATVHPYPTQAEIIKKAADTWRRTKLTSTVQKIFETWFRVFR